MISMNPMPAMTGTRALGTPSIGSWLTCDLALSDSYQSATTAHRLTIAVGVPATVAVSARPFAGSAGIGEAARKRDRPPRGEPR